VTGALTPPNVTVLVPCDAPKFVPVKVTDVPVGPEVGDMLLTLGGVPTWNSMPPPDKPFTLT
jgi:hypothetical protein